MGEPALPGLTMHMFTHTLISKAAFVLLAVSSMALATPARAQESSSPAATQEQINQQLMQRIEELEKEVQQLKGQPATPAAAAVPAPAPAPTPVADTPEVNEVAPRLHLDVFGDVGVQ